MTPNKMGSTACDNESQTCETGSGVKRKVNSGAHLGEWQTPISQTISPPAQTWGSYRSREKRVFFLHPIILLAFGLTHLSF